MDEREDAELVRPDEPDDDERDDVPDDRDDPVEVRDDDPVEVRDPDDVAEREDDRPVVVDRDEEDSLDDPFPACPGNLNLLRPSSRLSTYVRCPSRS